MYLDVISQLKVQCAYNYTYLFILLKKSSRVDIRFLDFFLKIKCNFSLKSNVLITIYIYIDIS